MVSESIGLTELDLRPLVPASARWPGSSSRRRSLSTAPASRARRHDQRPIYAFNFPGRHRPPPLRRRRSHQHPPRPRRHQQMLPRCRPLERRVLPPTHPHHHHLPQSPLVFFHASRCTNVPPSVARSRLFTGLSARPRMLGCERVNNGIRGRHRAAHRGLLPLVIQAASSAPGILCVGVGKFSEGRWEGYGLLAFSMGHASRVARLEGHALEARGRASRDRARRGCRGLRSYAPRWSRRWHLCAALGSPGGNGGG
jgi:hypothetical protein